MSDQAPTRERIPEEFISEYTVQSVERGGWQGGWILRLNYPTVIDIPLIEYTPQVGDTVESHTGGAMGYAIRFNKRAPWIRIFPPTGEVQTIPRVTTTDETDDF